LSDLWFALGAILLPAILMLVGILIIWRMLKDKKSGFPVADERTRRISGRAASYALVIGSYFMIAMIALLTIGQEFPGLPALAPRYALVASLLALDLSFLGLRWYFGRKADL